MLGQLTSLPRGHGGNLHRTAMQSGATRALFVHRDTLKKAQTLHLISHQKSMRIEMTEESYPEGCAALAVLPVLDCAQNRKDEVAQLCYEQICRTLASNSDENAKSRNLVFFH